MGQAIQDWDDSQSVGDRAVEIAKDFLLSEVAATYWIAVESVETVENHPASQKLGIDLLCKLNKGTKPVTRTEIKGDQNENSGNLFFETVSNVELNTPGCFVNCEAEWILYCFINIHLIYVIPMAETKDWFRDNLSRFKEVTVRSNRKMASRVVTWSTRGRLVPRKVIESEIPGIMKFRLSKGSWVWV